MEWIIGGLVVAVVILLIIEKYLFIPKSQRKRKQIDKPFKNINQDD